MIEEPSTSSGITAAAAAQADVMSPDLLLAVAATSAAAVGDNGDTPSQPVPIAIHSPSSIQQQRSSLGTLACPLHSTTTTTAQVSLVNTLEHDGSLPDLTVGNTLSSSSSLTNAVDDNHSQPRILTPFDLVDSEHHHHASIVCPSQKSSPPHESEPMTTRQGIETRSHVDSSKTTATTTTKPTSYQPCNPLVDIRRLERPSTRSRGTLYPSSLFRGKQTSGRSSYDVQVRILDVDFDRSTLCGYLSISHLTESHPNLTTFFSGEIIGEKYGFLTGSHRYYAQATEQDDLRHWSRFDRFRQVKSELRRPGLTMPDKERSSMDSPHSSPCRERPYVFMRWKERFLVPDHKVRDISGASFAGFYYLQLDLEPTHGGIHSQPLRMSGTSKDSSSSSSSSNGRGNTTSSTIYVPHQATATTGTRQTTRAPSLLDLSPLTAPVSSLSSSSITSPSSSSLAVPVWPSTPLTSTSSRRMGASTRASESQTSILPIPPPSVLTSAASHTASSPLVASPPTSPGLAGHHTLHPTSPTRATRPTTTTTTPSAQPSVPVERPVLNRSRTSGSGGGGGGRGHKASDKMDQVVEQPVLRGYYFHHQNSEP